MFRIELLNDARGFDMGRMIVLIVIFSCVVGVGFYLTFDHGKTEVLTHDSDTVKADMRKVKELLQSSEPYDAVEIISHYMSRSEDEESWDPQWVELAITAFEKIGDPFNLIGLYNHFPEAFSNHEEACLIIERLAVFFKDDEDFLEVRQLWKGREVQKAQWFLLDVDHLIVQGNFEEAEKLINSQEFDGKDEADRLIRWANLKSRKSLEAAWEVLVNAYEEDPSYPKVRSERGRLAEKAGNASLAQAEYMGALQLDPKNPMLRDQLAEFYRRHEQYKMALQTWGSGLAKPSADVIWLKTLFWSRMVYPVKIDWSVLEVPAGRYHGLVKYMLDLPEGCYWNCDAYVDVKSGGKFLESKQETFWMRLVAYLKEGEEEKALELLNSNPYREQSWHPELEAQLNRVLNYRLHGTLAYEGTPSVEGDELGDYEPHFAPSPLRHQFFEQLNTLTTSAKEASIAPQLQSLLLSSEAFSAVFMAAGWIEAALQLHSSAVISEDLPGWYAFGITQCLRQNRGSAAALAFAKKQSQTPALSLLIGELLVSLGSPEAGLEEFENLMGQDDEIGFHASWMAVNVHINQKEYALAKEIIGSHDELSKHVLGRESLARIAMLEGDEDLADRLYGELEEKSTEAKSYLARRAFARKHWKRARELTEELLMVFPSHPVLQENLKKIIYAEHLEVQAQ